MVKAEIFDIRQWYPQMLCMRIGEYSVKIEFAGMGWKYRFGVHFSNGKMGGKFWLSEGAYVMRFLELLEKNDRKVKLIYLASLLDYRSSFKHVERILDNEDERKVVRMLVTGLMISAVRHGDAKIPPIAREVLEELGYYRYARRFSKDAVEARIIANSIKR